MRKWTEGERTAPRAAFSSLGVARPAKAGARAQAEPGGRVFSRLFVAPGQFKPRVEHYWALKCSTKSMILKSFGLMILLASLSVVNGLAQTAKDDIKDAGQDIKQAGKSTGSAAKKTAKATKKTVKKGVNKAAEKTEEGANKVEEKTR